MTDVWVITRITAKIKNWEIWGRTWIWWMG